MDMRALPAQVAAKLPKVSALTTEKFIFVTGAAQSLALANCSAQWPLTGKFLSNIDRPELAEIGQKHQVGRSLGVSVPATDARSALVLHAA